jgi:hypothetical protein
MPTRTMPSVPSLDFSKLDLSKLQFPKVELPKFDLPKFEMPKFEMPKVDLPKFDLPKFEMPKVDLPKVDVDRLGELARDAAYVGVGLVTLTAQKVDDRRREIQAEITTRVRQLVDAIA